MGLCKAKITLIIVYIIVIAATKNLCQLEEQLEISELWLF